MRRTLVALVTATAVLASLAVASAPAVAATAPGPLFLQDGAIRTTTSTGAVSTLVSPSSGVHLGNPAYAPDHRSFVYSSSTDGSTSGSLYRYDLATRASTLMRTSTGLQVVGGNSGIPVPVAWFPSGTRLAFVSTNANSGTTRLFTINADGTGFAAVASVSPTVADTIRSVTVTADGRYIGYATTGDVWAVAPGGSPVRMSTGTDCGEVVARPGTGSELSYICGTYDDTSKATSTTVFSHAVGTAPRVFLQRTGSVATGGTSKGFQDIIWSHSGSRLLVQMVQTVFKPGFCQVDNTPRVFTVAASTQAITNVYTGPVNHVTCEGDIPTLKTVAWSPDDARVAFLDLTFTSSRDDLRTAPSAGGASTLVTHGAAKLTW